MVLHRMDWSILRPHVTIDNEELDDLRVAGVYVAGATDERIRQQEHLYDVLIDGTFELRLRKGELFAS